VRDYYDSHSGGSGLLATLYHWRLWARAERFHSDRQQTHALHNLTGPIAVHLEILSDRREKDFEDRLHSYG
jgi:hypothetical protein